MNRQLIERLRHGGHSLVIENADGIHTFDGRGVADLHTLVTDGRRMLLGASVADKVIGKGAAALMALGGVSEVYGEVISTHALSLLETAGIAVGFGKQVPDIINRNGDGVCPVEMLCRDCATPDECLPLITKFLSTRWQCRQPLNSTH